DFDNHVYTGIMSHNGTALATVTLDFRPTDPPTQPGFKHNVLVVEPPTATPPTTPQYDAECASGPVFNILTPVIGVRIATWQVSRAQQDGDAFHLTDTGSIVFPQGADGEFKRT